MTNRTDEQGQWIQEVEVRSVRLTWVFGVVPFRVTFEQCVLC